MSLDIFFPPLALKSRVSRKEVLMSTNTFKSIGAVFAGLVTALVLSLGTDFVLETTGVLPKGPLHDVRQGLIELAYRSVYTVLGSYIAASWLTSLLSYGQGA
jgi:lysophospholipid acyltransferase (LPLAT)-like uncharacterized protein